MRFFVGGERREETGEGERARGVRESFFVFLFFGVEMQVEKPCPLLSSCFFIFLQIEKSLPSAKFLRGNQVRKLGCQVRTWQPLWVELVESIPSQKNLAENKHGKNLPSCNLAAKFEFGTWHELGSDQISHKWYIYLLSTVIYACKI